MKGSRFVDWVAECFWPGVREADLAALDERAGRSAAAASASGQPVRYLGSVLMCEDEVVLCLFGGERSATRQAAVAAGIPFERILRAAGSPWALREGSSPVPEGSAT